RPDGVVRVDAADPLDGRLRHGLAVGDDREGLERRGRQAHRIGPDVAGDQRTGLGRRDELHPVTRQDEADAATGEGDLEIAALAGTDRATVDARLGDLEVSLRDRGIRLLIDGDRVELATAAEGGQLVARYVGTDAVRLSPASLETLAIVAYRQPVTKSAVERIRGVDSDYTIRTLVHRRFIVELGRSEAAGRPFLYGTGFEFLERFGLTSLDELPPLDVDIAARLAEEGGEPMTAPLFAEVGGANGADRANDSAEASD
ncbi:MAG: segregation and condensation protein, partial [Chloroflexota bacterium]|nr:segregation and condensation protein [Chloroflexota bacterium]